MEQCASNCHTLLLTTGKVAAVFAHGCIQTKGHISKIVVQSTALDGTLDQCPGVVFTESDVVANGGIEQKHILLNILICCWSCSEVKFFAF